MRAKRAKREKRATRATRLRHADKLDGIHCVFPRQLLRWIDPIWIPVLKLVNTNWNGLASAYGAQIPQKRYGDLLGLQFVRINKNMTYAVSTKNVFCSMYIYATKLRIFGLGSGCSKHIVNQDTIVYYTKDSEHPKLQLKINRNRTVIKIIHV